MLGSPLSQEHRCPSCEATIRGDGTACDECGTEAAIRCSACAAINPLSNLFCGRCGEGLKPDHRSCGELPAGRDGPVRTLSPERRQVTTLLVEVVADDAKAGVLATQADAELIEAGRTIVGNVALPLGGRQVVDESRTSLRFEFRRIRDNDARRAVEMAMAVLRKVKASRADLIRRFGASVSVRIGVHTAILNPGLSSGAGTGSRLTCPADAALLAEVAVPGTVVICGLTARLAGAISSLRPLGAMRLKGIDRPVELFRVGPPPNVMTHVADRLPEETGIAAVSSDGPPTNWQDLVTGGLSALQGGDMAESARCLDAALDQAHLMHDLSERQRAKFSIELARGRLYMRLNGDGAPEAERCFALTATLAPAVADDRDLFASLRGQSLSVLARGPFGRASRLCRQMIDLSRLIEDPLCEGEAFRLAAFSHFVNGDMAEAELHFARAFAEFDSIGSEDALGETWPALQARIGRAWLLWFQDRPNLAMDEVRVAEQQARTLGDEGAHAFALGVEASLGHLRQDPTTAATAGEACARVGRRCGLVSWEAWGELIAGWAAVVGGDQRGIAMMREGWCKYVGTGASLLDLYARTLLADGLRRTGRAEEALDILDFDRVGSERSAPFMLVEAYLTRGRLAVALDRPADLATDLSMALAIARRQGSIMLERRVALFTRHRRGAPAIHGIDASFDLLLTDASRP